MPTTPAIRRLGDHKQLHHELYNDLPRLLQDIKKDKPVTSLDLLDFLKRRLFNHIVKEDQAFRDFLS